MNQFKTVCGSAETENKAVHDVEQNMTADKQIDMVNVTAKLIISFHVLMKKLTEGGCKSNKATAE